MRTRPNCSSPFPQQKTIDSFSSDGFSSPTVSSAEQDVLPFASEACLQGETAFIEPIDHVQRPSDADLAMPFSHFKETGKAIPEDPTVNITAFHSSTGPKNGSTRRNWDAFRLLPPKPDQRGRGIFYEFCLQLLKITTFLVLFVLTLISAVLAKTTFLLMSSAIGQVDRNISICPDKIPEAKTNEVFLSSKNTARWAWALLIALCAPEILCFVRCFHRTMFRSVKRPTPTEFTFVFCIESFYAFGITALSFDLIPYMPVLTVLMLSNAVCLVPAVLTALSRHSNRWLVCFMALDIVVISIGSTIFWVLPRILTGPETIFAAICLTLISSVWWQNFVHQQSFFAPIRWIAAFANRLRECRSKTYVVVSPWKCIIYCLCMFYFLTPRIPLNHLLRADVFSEQLVTIRAYRLNETEIQMFKDRMQNFDRLTYKMSESQLSKKEKPGQKSIEKIDVSKDESDLPKSKNDSNKVNGKNEKKPIAKDNMNGMLRRSESESKHKPIEVTTNKLISQKEMFVAKRSTSNVPSQAAEDNMAEEETVAAYNIYDDYVEMNQFTTPYDALWIAAIQILSAIICCFSSKFACKVMMQRFGFALPMALVVPVCVLLLSDACLKRAQDPCYMTSIINKELFWQFSQKPKNFRSSEFWTDSLTILWLLWLVAQLWVTIHVWAPKHEKLANSETLFILSYYNGFFVDQSLVLNRRRDDETKIRYEDLDSEIDDVDCQQAFRVTGTPSLCSVSSRIDPGLIKESPSSSDAVSKIYVCATMWHESVIEQFHLLKSLFRLDEDQCARRNAQKYLKVADPDYYEFEAHIFFGISFLTIQVLILKQFFDDALDTTESGKTAINKFVRQLIVKIDEAANAVHQTRIELKTPTKCLTPYGGRLSWTLPGKNRLYVHLKDKSKIRSRKRWSQVMYLYYLLGYKLMLKISDKGRRNLLAENTYILTLDGDVDFQPDCVHLLVDLMKKNRRLGAACGRIHPRGSGLMIWYQKFEYAVGHWLQKATEHMIGCVLCSPGCFSLFRSYALMDDDVARKYATKSEKPLHYIQYDQGEDRWLCTLLLQRGYRVEYCAASDALTFAPEGFNEFFNQRRRWIPSTLANIIDLLRSYRNVVNANESISVWYIFYQFVMLVSSILGPGTIFLMIVGAISISFNIDTRFALLIVAMPVVCFCICCSICKTETQLLMAQMIGGLFAMLMTAVIVGTSLQIQKDGITSPHSVFLFTVLGSIAVAAVLHPLEFTCAIPVVLYFLAIPCMYMLLPIYSLTNLNTFGHWGTRENTSAIENENKSSSSSSENPRVVDGELSVGCGSLCRLVCCVRPKSVEDGIREISRRLDNIESMKTGKTIDSNKNPSVNIVRDANQQPQLDLSNAEDNTRHELEISWIDDESLQGFEKSYLEGEEENFWVELIEKYLQPQSAHSNERERIQSGLTELRNKTCSAFFLINAVFIIVVLVLQMQKDCIHIEWPFGPKVNHTLLTCHSDDAQEVWVMSRLQLEPISLVFLVFFMSILLIQFFAMLMHRFGTLTHIIASTELFCFRKRSDKLSEDDLVVQNAVEIARELQAIRGVDRIHQGGPISMVRKNIGNGVMNVGCMVKYLESPAGRKRPTETLDAAFKKRFFSLSSNEVDSEIFSTKMGRYDKRLTLNRRTIRALEQRRDSLYKGRHGNGDNGKKNGYQTFSSDSEDISLEGAARRRATSPPSENSPPFYGPSHYARQQFKLDQLFQREQQ